MKRNDILRSLLTGLLALALLAGVTAAAPASGAEGEVTALYTYQSAATDEARAKMLKEFANNVVNERETPNSAYPQWTGTICTRDGAAAMGGTGMYISLVPEKYTEGSLHYGLPYEVIPGNYKKMTENLKVELTGVKYPIQTRDVGALNLRMTYLQRRGSTNSPVFDRELQVRVSVDGTNYLPGSVGLRSAKLLGGGVLTTPSAVPAVLYELETEDLLTIPGFKKGDQIKKIMLLPNGEYTRTFGFFYLQGLELNSYKTKEAFERLVPAEEIKTVKLDPRTVRQIAVEEGLRVCNTEWSTGSTVYTGSPAGSSTVATSTSYRNYPGNMLYRGPVYGREVDSTRELFQSAIVDGEYVGGLNTDVVYSMDCQCFVWNAISRVSRSYAWAVMITPGSPKTTMLGEDFLKARPRVSFTDYDVTTQNTAQDVYRAYALIDAGDIVIHYLNDTSNSVHTRLATSNHVAYNADGTIDGRNSYITVCEQDATVCHWVRLPDGREEEVRRSTWAAYVKLNPDARILYTYNCYPNNKSTYETLYKNGYLGYTLDEYQTGEIELERVSCVFASKESGKDLWDAGACISYDSNYRVIGHGVTLEDLSTGTVLYQDDELNIVNYYVIGVYDKAALNEKLKALPDGKYRLSFRVDSGPFTSPEQTRVPSVTKSMDFEVTGRGGSDKLRLEAPASVTAGSAFSVRLVSAAPFDAADAEVKFDQSKLTFTGAAEAVGQTVKRDGGIVRVIRVGAGSSDGVVAALNFTANADVTIADAILLKSAFVSTAAQANTSDMDKATDGGEPYPSVGMKDVMPGAWYRPAVDWALAKGVMSGYSANTFGPDNTLTRAMVVQVLYNKENKPASNAANPFKDIAADQWYFNAVRWGADKGVVAGYGGGVFKPDDNVTVEQVAVILHNYAGKPASGGDASGVGVHSDWADAALAWAAEKDLMKDMPCESVTAPATRAQTAQMLMNYLQDN